MKAGNFYNGLLGSPKLPKLGTGKCLSIFERELTNYLGAYDAGAKGLC
jgi:hypothetical protein